MRQRLSVIALFAVNRAEVAERDGDTEIVFDGLAQRERLLVIIQGQCQIVLSRINHTDIAEFDADACSVVQRFIEREALAVMVERSFVIALITVNVAEIVQRFRYA
jgi:hypothetical protein